MAIGHLPRSGSACSVLGPAAVSLGATLPSSSRNRVTLAEPETSPAPRGSSVATRRAWTIAVGGSVLALAIAVVVLPGAVEPFRPLHVLFVAVLFLVSESVVMHVEFRRQTYSWSLAELALTVALIEIGGLWTALTWVAAIAVLMVAQSYAPAKAVFNLAMVLLHASVAVAVLSVLPEVEIAEPLGWFSLILAVLVANLRRGPHDHGRRSSGPPAIRVSSSA